MLFCLQAQKRNGIVIVFDFVGVCVHACALVCISMEHMFLFSYWTLKPLLHVNGIYIIHTKWNLSITI